MTKLAKLVCVLLVAAIPAAAQTVPTIPQSGFAANGAPVVMKHDIETVFGTKLDVNGDSSELVVKPGAGSNKLSLSSAFGVRMDARGYGVKCDGVTDDAQAIANMVNSITPGTPARVQLPPGVCVLASLATLTAPAVIEGHGGGPEGTPGANGTWLHITQQAAGIVFTGSAVRGAAVRDLGVMQDQPASTAGWSPTPYGPVFSVLNTYGGVSFDNIMFAGVNKGIYAYNSGRLHVGTIFGQFYTSAIELDAMYDVTRLDHVHCWPFVDQTGPVMDYSTANGDCLLTHRVDGLAIGDLFSFGMRAGAHLDSSSLGGTHAFQISNLYADYGKYGVWASGNDTAGQLGNLVSTHALFSALPTIVHIPGSAAVRVDGSNTFIGVNQLRAGGAESSGVQVAGSNNRLGIDQTWIEGWNTKNDGSAAIAAYDGGAGGPNIVQLGAPPILTEGAGFATSMIGASVLTRAMQMNLLNGSVNEPRAFTSAAGTGVSIGATGGDASIDFALNAKGPTGSVLLNADNSRVLRLDNPAGAGDSNLLMRSLPGNVLMTPETTNANASITLNGKGLGGVIVGGPLILAAPGVCLTTDCAMRARASADGTRMILSVGGADNASLDAAGNLRVRGAVTPNATP